MRAGLGFNERTGMWLSSLLGAAHHVLSLTQVTNDTRDVPSNRKDA